VTLITSLNLLRENIYHSQGKSLSTVASSQWLNAVTTANHWVMRGVLLKQRCSGELQEAGNDGMGWETEDGTGKHKFLLISNSPCVSFIPASIPDFPVSWTCFILELVEKYIFFQFAHFVFVESY
jgi:hypothetical protein